ncbi:MAG: DNA repair protein RecN [Christensenellales bacterium]
MLEHLLIRNIALIANLEIDLSPGLNVLTGETGAGKSIIIDAVNLALGERADRELIKSGEEKATVEAVFTPPKAGPLFDLLVENGLYDDGALVLFRQINEHNKNICRINGTMVPLALLREISDSLVDVHGQHQHQSLLDPKKHLAFLDAFSRDAIKQPLGEVRLYFEQYEKVLAGLKKKFGGYNAEQRLDMINFQIDEIKKASFVAGEKELLEQERLVLANAEKIMSSLSLAYDALYDRGQEAAIVLLSDAKNAMEQIGRYGDKYKETAQTISNIYYQTEDVAMGLRDMKSTMDFSPERLEEIEARLAMINRLCKKYGGSVEDLLRQCEDLETEQYEILHAQQILEKLEREKSELEGRLFEACAKLSEARKKQAAVFEQKILEKLEYLGFQTAAFEVRFNNCFEDKEQAKGSFTKRGFDDVEFLFSANRGQPVKPLGAVISGGELSRMMLAIKTVMAELDQIPTLIFDEIDTGMSGVMGQKVASELSRIAQARQVLCVSHLAQIAAVAQEHFAVQKQEVGEGTIVEVLRLDQKGRTEEIARILDGKTDISIEHAMQMIQKAQERNK